MKEGVSSCDPLLICVPQCLSDREIVRDNPWWGYAGWEADDPHLRRLGAQPVRLPSPQVEAPRSCASGGAHLAGAAAGGRVDRPEAAGGVRRGRVWRAGGLCIRWICSTRGPQRAGGRVARALFLGRAGASDGTRLILLDEVTAAHRRRAAIQVLWERGRSTGTSCSARAPPRWFSPRARPSGCRAGAAPGGTCSCCRRFRIRRPPLDRSCRRLGWAAPSSSPTREGRTARRAGPAAGTGRRAEALSPLRRAAGGRCRARSRPTRTRRRVQAGCLEMARPGGAAPRGERPRRPGSAGAGRPLAWRKGELVADRRGRAVRSAPGVWSAGLNMTRPRRNDLARSRAMSNCWRSTTSR